MDYATLTRRASLGYLLTRHCTKDVYGPLDTDVRLEPPDITSSDDDDDEQACFVEIFAVR